MVTLIPANVTLIPGPVAIIWPLMTPSKGLRPISQFVASSSPSLLLVATTFDDTAQTHNFCPADALPTLWCLAPCHLSPGNPLLPCHRFLSPGIMRPPFEGIHRRILITRALCGFVGCDQCRRAHVCHERPTSTREILQFLQPAAVQTCRLSLRTFNIRCAMQNCTFGAPPGQY